MKQSKKQFYPKGPESGKRALLFNLQKTNLKEYNSMTLSEKVMCLSFLEDCKDVVQEWIDELKIKTTTPQP